MTREVLRAAEVLKSVGLIIEEKQIPEHGPLCFCLDCMGVPEDFPAYFCAKEVKSQGKRTMRR